MNTMNREDFQRLGNLAMSVLLEQDGQQDAQPAAQPQAPTGPATEGDNPMLEFKKDLYFAARNGQTSADDYMHRFLINAMANGILTSIRHESKYPKPNDFYENDTSTRRVMMLCSDPRNRRSAASELAKELIETLNSIDINRVLSNATFYGIR